MSPNQAEPPDPRRTHDALRTGCRRLVADTDWLATIIAIGPLVESLLNVCPELLPVPADETQELPGVSPCLVTR